MSAVVNGVIYLLCIHEDGGEDVVRYIETEMAELFSADDRAILDFCGTVVVCHRSGNVAYIDMVAAARNVFYEN